VALPVILGASALKGTRMAGAGLPPRMRTTMAAGGLTAFLSTLVSARMLRRSAADARPLLPFALYRCMLGALVVRRLRRAQ
jgi:undecaprenyl-diphosphatase